MILGVRRYNDRLTPRLRPNDLDGCVDLLRPVPQMTEIALRRAILQTLNKFLIRSEEHTSELQSLMRISYAVFCLKKKKTLYTVLTRTDQVSIYTKSYNNMSTLKH